MVATLNFKIANAVKFQSRIIYSDFQVIAISILVFSKIVTAPVVTITNPHVLGILI